MLLKEFYFYFFVIMGKVKVFCKKKVKANKHEYLEQFKVRSGLQLNIKCLIKIIFYQLCYNTLLAVIFYFTLNDKFSFERATTANFMALGNI